MHAFATGERKCATSLTGSISKDIILQRKKGIAASLGGQHRDPKMECAFPKRMGKKHWLTGNKYVASL